jgi:hypothetical protein
MQRVVTVGRDHAVAAEQHITIAPLTLVQYYTPEWDDQILFAIKNADVNILYQSKSLEG